MRILVVDDEPDVATLVKMGIAYSRPDYEIVESHSGADALERAAREPWDLVINTGRANVNAVLDMLAHYTSALIRDEAEQDRLSRLQLAGHIEHALLTDQNLGVDKLRVRVETDTIVLEGQALAREDRQSVDGDVQQDEHQHENRQPRARRHDHGRQSIDEFPTPNAGGGTQQCGGRPSGG